MKRSTFLSILILTLSTAEAQRPFNVALIGGFNAAQIDGDNFAGYEKLGINAGAKAYANFIESFSLGLELLISQKGSKNDLLLSNSGNKFKLALNYAEVPITLNFHDRDRAIFSAGVVYSRLVGCSLVEFAEAKDCDSLHLNSRDWNWVVEVTLKAWKQFGFNLRFAYSMLPIAQWPGSQLPNFGVFNNLVSVRFMWFPKLPE